MKLTIHRYLLCLACIALLATGCKKDSKPVPPPTVSTVAATAITTTSATAGGTASGEGITEVGLFYSKTQTTPDGSDGKMPGALNNGSFSVNLSGLQAGSTYYIRAYATNASGTSFGNTLSFMTGNAGPEAKSVKIAGDKTVGATLSATYSYSDNENDPESGSTLQWYAANDTIGATVTPINGATAATFIITSDLKDKFIRVGVTPKASSGTTPGVEGKSYWFGPIGGETVTFMYNGKSVTYGVIVSPTTGKKWLDRNLGAPNVPSSFKDWANYGDLFQWGRSADGHQLVKRAATEGETEPFYGLNDITTTLSTTDKPGHHQFIVPSAKPFDWRNPSKLEMWQGTDGGSNNPCPAGYHVPSLAEWHAELAGFSNNDDPFLKLNLTAGGFRFVNGSAITSVNVGSYWTSSFVTLDGPDGEYFMSTVLIYSGSEFYENADVKGCAYSVRCVKN